MTWTKEQMNEFRRLREEQRERDDREREAWRRAATGYTDTDVVYAVQYRKPDDQAWYVASPFFEPLQLEPDETEDRERALAMAKAIKEGRHPTSRGREITPITATRVIERVHRATVAAMFE